VAAPALVPPPPDSLPHGRGPDAARVPLRRRGTSGNADEDADAEEGAGLPARARHHGKGTRVYTLSPFSIVELGRIFSLT
jgi:hypothetical protein